jgi:hypothetical protein
VTPSIPDGAPTSVLGAPSKSRGVHETTGRLLFTANGGDLNDGGTNGIGFTSRQTPMPTSWGIPAAAAAGSYYANLAHDSCNGAQNA